jgi:hypothetical protein
MLRFSERVYDNLISGTQPMYTDVRFCELLGSADVISLAGQIEGVRGSSPTLVIQVEHSADKTRWVNRNTAPEVSLSLTPPTTILPPPASTPMGPVESRTGLPYVRLRMQLSGTTPSGVLRLYIVGRDPAR